MSEQERAARRQRLGALREAGCEPFPARVGPWQPIAELRAKLDGFDTETLEEKAERTAVVGRVTWDGMPVAGAVRVHVASVVSWSFTEATMP